MNDLLKSTYQTFKSRSQTRAELESEIERYTYGIGFKDAEAAQSIRKELSKLLKKDKDFK